MPKSRKTEPVSLVEHSLAVLRSMDDRRPASQPRSPLEALEPSRAPERPNRAERVRFHPLISIMNGLLTLVFIMLIGLGGLVYFLKVQFDKPGPLQTSATMVVPKGQGVNFIAARLEREGIITDKTVFVASVFYFRAQSKLKAGEYQFPKHASMRDVLDRMVEGKAILHSVSIPEGFTSAQVVQRLNKHELLVGDIAEIPAEGSLLPDTYRFNRHSKRQELIARMQAGMKRFVTKLWAERAPGLPIKTPAEALILASIVEKETGRADERGRIAGVFINRLNKGMRLQSDPTIIYGITNGKGPLGRPIYRSDIDKRTAYNTYHIDRLPPTPIANPGRAAIEAVLNPVKTDALFFVADGTGGHAFTTTYADHNRNVKRWRVIEREARERQKAEALKRGDEEALARLNEAAAEDTATPEEQQQTTETPAAESDVANEIPPLPDRKPRS